MSEKLVAEGILSKGYGISPKLVMKDRSLSIEAKAIYAYMSSYAGGGETAYPSVELICEDLNISDVRYRKHRKSLIDAGYIEVVTNRTEGSKFTNNVYVIKQVIEKPSLQNIVTVKHHDGKLPSRQNIGTNNNSLLNNNNILNNNSNNNAQLSLLDDVPNIQPKKLTKMEQAFINTKDDFERFYQTYPRKIGKKLAHEKFIKALEVNTVDEIMNGTIRYAAYCQVMRTETNFIKHPSTFLNQQSYLDDYGRIGKAKQPIQYGDNLIPVTKKENDNNVRESEQPSSTTYTPIIDGGKF